MGPRPMETFFRKLALLLGSGVPLADAVGAIAAGLGPGEPPGGMLAHVAAALAGGARLSEALGTLPGVFPAEVIAIVRSGEAHGQLEAAAARIAQGLADGTLGVGVRSPAVPGVGPVVGGGPPIGAVPPSMWPGPLVAHGSGRAPFWSPPVAAAPGPVAGPERGWHSTVHGLLAEAMRAGASDVHVEPSAQGGRIRMRIDGVLREHRRLGPPEYEELMTGLKTAAGMDVRERRRGQDRRWALDLDDRRVWMRAATGPYVHGEAFTARFMEGVATLPRVDELGLSAGDLARVRRWLARSYGLLIVTGPTGSGKTTTLYTLLSAYDAARSKVITVEQPAEFLLDGVNQLSLVPELGLTWEAAIRMQLRHDPDVLMIGEVAGEEVARMVLQCALTGHVVLTALHAGSAAGLLWRLKSVGLEPGLLADGIVGILAQRLVRRLCTACREADPAPSLPSGTSDPPVLPPGTYFKARGCPACGGTGYRYREAVFELGEATPAVVEALAKGESPVAVARALAAEGFGTLLADGLARASTGQTTIDEVFRVAVV